MNVIETPIPGVVVLEPRLFHDTRGYFFEMFRENALAEVGLPGPWVQDNCSFSRRGVLRGLHFQWPNPQGKLVQAVNGEIWDVAVDIRVGSATYGKWHGEVLSEANRRQLWVPEGFAHGFVVLSESALVTYKVSAYFDAACDAGVKWDDPGLAIDWPLRDVVVSEKDAGLPRLEQLQVDRSPHV